MDNLEDLFQAWQSGDMDARNKWWEHLWGAFYSAAIGYCRGLCGDETRGADCATDAFHRTLEELDKKVVLGEVSWQGPNAFQSYVWERLSRRCYDRLRVQWRHERLTSPLDADDPEEDEEGSVSLISILASDANTPEQELIDKERDQSKTPNKTSSPLGLLATALEICRIKKSEALVDTISAILEFARLQLLESASGTRDAEKMDPDELLKHIGDLDLDFVFEKTDMNEFIMVKLGIERNKFDQRMRRIRNLLAELRLLLG